MSSFKADDYVVTTVHVLFLLDVNCCSTGVLFPCLLVSLLCSARL